MKSMQRRIERTLKSWICVLPLLLFVAMFSLSQIDIYRPAPDEFLSMFNSGWAGDRGRSLLDVLRSLQEHSPQQGPFYYLILHSWGRLVGHELAAGRILSILISMPGFAVLYRLARDHVSPGAGVFAVGLLAFNAFYGHYIVYIRMYALLLLLSSLALWLYARLSDQTKSSRAYALAAMFITCYALLLTHAFSALLYAAVAHAHLLERPKGKPWLGVTLAAGAALACWALTILVLGSGAEGNYVPNPASFGDIVGAWLNIVSNGNYALLALTGLGLLWGIRHYPMARLRYFLFMLAVFTALVGATSSFVSVGRVRYFLPGLPLAIVAMSAGLDSWLRLRWWLGIALLGLFALAGSLFHQFADWDDLLGARHRAYTLPPWHTISRQALTTEPFPAILALRLAHHDLTKGGSIEFSLSDHYFGTHGIQVRQTSEFRYLDGIVKDLALRAPVIWLVTQSERLEAGEFQDVTALLESIGYANCGERQYEADTQLTEWVWSALRCYAPQALAQYANNAIDYIFYGANLNSRADALSFRYRWDAQDKNSADNLRVSHQLVDAAFRNLAQLDLPLVYEGDYLQFSIDTAHVPPGDYRLMAVVYHADTGERQIWHDNDGWIPEMRQLAEIEIPATVRDSP